MRTCPGRLVTEAMAAIEQEFEPLLGVLPKDYGIFETKVLEDLVRLFSGSDSAEHASGSVYRRCAPPVSSDQDTPCPEP